MASQGLDVANLSIGLRGDPPATKDMAARSCASKRGVSKQGSLSGVRKEREWSVERRALVLSGRSVICGSPQIRGRGNVFRRSIAGFVSEGPCFRDKVLDDRDFRRDPHRPDGSRRPSPCPRQPSKAAPRSGRGRDPRPPERAGYVSPRPQAPHPVPRRQASRTTPLKWGRDKGLIVLIGKLSSLNFLGACRRPAAARLLSPCDGLRPALAAW